MRDTKDHTSGSPVKKLINKILRESNTRKTRDQLRDYFYFKKLIDRNTKGIAQSRAVEIDPANHDHRDRVQSTIAMSQYGIVFAMYSMGADLREVKHAFLDLIKDIPDSWSEWYSHHVNILSLGILLEVEAGQIDAYLDLVENGMKRPPNPRQRKIKSYDDWLLTFLIHQIRPYGDEVDIAAKPVFAPKLYEPLYNIVYKADDKTQALKEYLDKFWYKAHREAAWYDSHKRDPKDMDRATYVGYWCFVSGAIAKVLGLDDSLLKDTPYYPYDLVHFY